MLKSIKGEKKMTEEQLQKRKEYQNKYRREMYKRMTLRIKLTDTEILEKLESVDNITDYVKSLILADIKKEAK